MEWLFKPKVQLGLFVNFIFFMFTLVTSTAGDGRAHEYSSGLGYEPPPPKLKSLPDISLPTPTGPSKASSNLNKETGEFSVYLDKDISLISRPDLVLILSPTCTVSSNNEQPRSVLLRFIAYSRTQYFAHDESLTITANGEQIWPVKTRDGNQQWQGWTEARVPRSVTFNSDGNVVETIGKDIPYSVFVKVVSAKRVRFQLGPEDTYLTKEQLGALRDMYQRLSQPPVETRKQF